MSARAFFLKNERGFTIVELMAAATLATLFSFAVFGAFYVMRNEMFQQSVFFTTNRSVRHALDLISKDIREAVRIVPSRAGDTTGNAVLILELPSIDANGDATDIDTQFDYVVYKLNPAKTSELFRDLDVLGGTSQRNAGSDITDKVVATSVQNLSFTSGGTGLSSIADVGTLFAANASITSRGTTLRASQTQTTQGDTDVRLRNRQN
jgi:type II secretory pathway pseudopilin PulG